MGWFVFKYAQLCVIFLIKCELDVKMGAGIAHWWCVGLAVLLERCHGFDPPSGKGDFSLGVNMGSDSSPPKLFQMRV